MSDPRPVIICTEYRGVFYGLGTDTSGDTVTLQRVRCAIRWGTTRGLLELADTGPTDSSKISAEAPEMELRKVTAVISLSDTAAAKWAALP